ncbi:MAG: PspC domain-containing protein [Candidatus Roizmanbacteria bacterium]|nr:PspC domain-containing protein [Candidatus Roizmanbacteria bacterium]
MIKNEKRLLRDSKNKMLAGVASGIAHYFDVDPNIIRLLFIVLTVCGGSGFLIYILLWLLLPSDTSKTVDGRDMFKENVQQMKEAVQEFAKEVKREAHQEVSEKKEKSQQSLGVILVVVGLIFLLTNLGLLDLFIVKKLWPILLIFLGILVVYKNEN